MADDNKLRVSAEFDVSPIVAGTTQAANAFDNLGGKVEKNSELAQLAIQQLTDKAANLGVRMMGAGKSTDEITAAMQKVGLTAEESATLMQLLTDEAVKQAIALRNAGNAGEEAGAKQVNAFVMARVEAAALSGSTTGIERGLLQVAARSETLGPILQKAFSAFLIVAFIELLEQAVDAIGNATQSIAGFGKEVQKEYLEAIAFNQRLIDVNLEAQDKVAKIAEIGKEGAAKYAVESKNAAESTRRWADRLGELNKDLPAAQEELQRLTRAASRWNDPLAGLTDVDFQLEKQKQRVTELTKEWEQVYLKVKDTLPLEKQKAAADEADRAFKQLIADELAAVEATRTVADAQIKQDEEIAKERLAFAKLAAEKNSDALKEAIGKEMNDRVTLETRQFEADTKALEAERNLKVQEAAHAGGDVAKIVEDYNAKIEALAITHNTRLLQITSAGELAIRGMEKAAREAAEREREEDLKKTQDDAQKELQTVERAMIEKVRLQSEAGRKQLEETERQAAEARKVDISGIFGETGKQQIQDATDAFQREQAQVASMVSTYEDLLVVLRQLGVQEDSHEFLTVLGMEQKALEQLDTAWHKYQSTVDQVAEHQQQVFKQAFDRVTTTLNQGLVNALSKTESWGQAMAKVWNSLASAAIENLAKVAEQELVSLIAHQELVDSEKLDDAKSAASGAYRSVMDSAIPFPLNFALAAAAGATAFAAVMAFERGGIVPGARGEALPAILHGGEAVLPAHVAQPLIGAIPTIANLNRAVDAGEVKSGGGSTYKTMHNHIRVNISNQGGQIDHEAIVASVRRGIRTGALSL